MKKRENVLEQLSVIVPIYNSEKFLETCLDSILFQNYKYLEIILVDDGSIDSSGDICDRYAQRDSRIKVLHKENEGLIKARYDGLMMANSNWVTFVDSDDWINEDMYSQLMEKVCTEELDMITSGCIRYFSEETFDKSVDININEGIYEKEAIDKRIVPIMLWDDTIHRGALDPSLCFKIFKKELLQQQFQTLKDYSFYYGEDSAILFPYVLSCKKIRITNGTFYFHRQRPKGINAPYFENGDYFDQLYDLYSYLKTKFNGYENSTELLEQLEKFYINAIEYKKRIYKYSFVNGYRHLFPFNRVKYNSKIVLYGAGVVGDEYYRQINELEFCDIVLWIDRSVNSEKNVKGIEEIKNIEFDYVVIAVLSDKSIKDIKEQLFDLGVNENKIIAK